MQTAEHSAHIATMNKDLYLQVRKIIQHLYSYIFIFRVSKIFFKIYKRIKKELRLKTVIHIYLPDKRIRSTSGLKEKDKGMV